MFIRMAKLSSCVRMPDMAGELAKSSLVIVRNRMCPMMLASTCKSQRIESINSVGLIRNIWFDNNNTSRKFGPLTSISLLAHSLVPQRLTASNRSVSLMTRSSSFTRINSVDSVMSSNGACDRESFVRHRIRFRLLSCQVQQAKLMWDTTRRNSSTDCLPWVKSLQTSLQIQGLWTRYREWDPSTCIGNTSPPG